MRLSVAGVVIILAVLSQTALGAVVHGNVYDLSLSKVSGALVQINSTPEQQMISSQDGYRFVLGEGVYLLEARFSRGAETVEKDNRTLVISDEGTYVIDLILFPVFEEEDAQEPVVAEELTEERANPALLVLFLLLMLFGGLAFWFAKSWEQRKRDASEAEGREGEHLIGLIRKSGGRMTQKELRTEMPMSEAKISLLVAELEQKGRIEKIKRGRGNILVLKK